MTLYTVQSVNCLFRFTFMPWQLHLYCLARFPCFCFDCLPFFLGFFKLPASLCTLCTCAACDLVLYNVKTVFAFGWNLICIYWLLPFLCFDCLPQFLDYCLPLCLFAHLSKSKDSETAGNLVNNCSEHTWWSSFYNGLLDWFNRILLSYTAVAGCIHYS